MGVSEFDLGFLRTGRSLSCPQKPVEWVLVWVPSGLVFNLLTVKNWVGNLMRTEFLVRFVHAGGSGWRSPKKTTAWCGACLC